MKVAGGIIIFTTITFECYYMQDPESSVNQMFRLFRLKMPLVFIGWRGEQTGATKAC